MDNSLFNEDLGDLVLGRGKIESITDGVAWGTFEQGFTFDLPVQDFHQIGDDVRMSENLDAEATGSTHLFMIMGDHHCTVLWCDITDEGYEIVAQETLTR